MLLPYYRAVLLIIIAIGLLNHTNADNNEEGKSFYIF